MSEKSDKPPSGPWSDLPAAPPAPRLRPTAWRPAMWAPGRRRGTREPLVNNWRGVLIVVFLLFVAPPLAAWAAHLIMGMVNR